MDAARSMGKKVMKGSSVPNTGDRASRTTTPAAAADAPINNALERVGLSSGSHCFQAIIGSRPAPRF
jgi:hypothetical protein